MAETYRLQIAREATKEILNLPPKVRRQVENNIDHLLDTLTAGARPQDMKPLKSEPGSYRIAAGEYRIVFELDDRNRVVTVYRVRHRKDVYRNL